MMIINPNSLWIMRNKRLPHHQKYMDSVLGLSRCQPLGILSDQILHSRSLGKGLGKGVDRHSDFKVMMEKGGDNNA